ncbi:major vault protein-like isoform X2 [Glandiceps talaboti]
MSDIVGIGPAQFIHVLNVTTNITSLEVGPKTSVLQTNEKLVAGPLPCVVIPPGHYCIVKDPISTYEEGKPCQLKHGHFEVRFHKEPFPLYPGESLVDAPDFLSKSPRDYSRAVKPLPVVKAHHAIKLLARVDHDDNGVNRKAGDIWQLEGPLTYRPTAEAEIVEIVKPTVIIEGQALRLRAMIDFTDRNNEKRLTGQEWLVRKPGAYLKEAYEVVIKVETSFTLTEDIALHLKATETVTDSLGEKRLAGAEWLLTCEQTESYIPDIGVEVVSKVNKTILGKNEFCVVYDPVDNNGHNKFGQKELRKGIYSFFLQPGENLPNGIQKAFLLQEDQAVVIQSTIAFTDDTSKVAIERKPGDKWLIRGPCNYIPPVEVKVLKQPNGKFVRNAIPLAHNEGIYVRNLRSGEVRAVMGPQSYLLQEYEELSNKELSALTETLLRKGGGHGGEEIRKMAYFESSIDPALAGDKPRDKTRVVTYRCPGNTAVQVYNYKKKTARVIFGPDMVILGPDENFNILSLSAGKPKVENALKSICLMLGPDFITDIIEVETSDHARLSIKIAFNNTFEFKMGDPKEEQKIFSVPDFIGFACKQVGSRIRGAVAHTPFDTFHRYSSNIIKAAVFGVDEDKHTKSKLCFAANGLCITNADIQSIEPVDAKMRDSLSKSVQMAIEISTNSVEAAASHEARRTEQKAKGQIERQKLLNEQENEKARTELYELRAVTAAVESTGQAKAEAQAQAEKLLIEGESEIEAARLKAQAEEIESNAELETQKELRSAELSYTKDINTLEISKAKQLSEIEVSKFGKMVTALGVETITAVATSGPQQQVELLKGLGITTTLITSGENPINLFNYAHGLVGNDKK